MRNYAVCEGTGKRILVDVQCDYSGCTATIKPHPQIAKSGWTKRGFIPEGVSGCSGDPYIQLDYCPQHSE